MSPLGAVSFLLLLAHLGRKVLKQCQGHFPWRRKETCKPATHQSVGKWLGSELVSVWARHTKSPRCTPCPSSVFEIYPVTRSSVGSCRGAGKARLGPRDAGEWSWSHFGQSRCKTVTGSKSRNGDKGSGWVIVHLASSCQALCAWLGAQAEAADPAFRVVTVKSEHLQAGCGMQWYVFIIVVAVTFICLIVFIYSVCRSKGRPEDSFGELVLSVPCGLLG